VKSQTILASSLFAFSLAVLCNAVQECDATRAKCLFNSQAHKNKKALLWKQNGL